MREIRESVAFFRVFGVFGVLDLFLEGIGIGVSWLVTRPV